MCVWLLAMHRPISHGYARYALPDPDPDADAEGPRASGLGWGVGRLGWGGGRPPPPEEEEPELASWMAFSRSARWRRWRGNAAQNGMGSAGFNNTNLDDCVSRIHLAMITDLTL
jgi:hypothetical protein